MGHPLALEPEGGGTPQVRHCRSFAPLSPSPPTDLLLDCGAQFMNWGTMGWGYWGYPFVPGVDRWKVTRALRLRM